jgi:hypothetical protein
MAFRPNQTYAPVGEYTAAPGTVDAVTVKLVSVTVAGSQPSQIFTANVGEALDAGLAIGQPYCAVAGTVVIPFINPTAGNIAQDDVTVKIAAL